MLIYAVDAFIYNVNELRAGISDIDLDVKITGLRDFEGFRGFEWEVIIPRQSIPYSSVTYDENDEEVYSWEVIDFDPLKWKVKVKEEVGVISSGGFCLSSVEIHLKEKLMILKF